MEKYSSIDRKTCKNQMMLAYDCLHPELASKLINCFYDDKLCEMLGFCETSIVFSPYKVTEDRWSKDLVMFVETPEFVDKGATQEEIDKAMDDDYVILLAIQQRIKELSGIE